MTMSLPVTLPAQAVAGKAGSSAPAKGVASAPGQQAKNASGTAEATGVADMFAALVATLTAQMQPAAQTPAVEGQAAAVADGVDGTVPNLFAILGEAPVVLDAAAATAAATAAVEGAVAEGVPADGVTAEAAPVVDGEAAAVSGEIVDLGEQVVTGVLGDTAADTAGEDPAGQGPAGHRATPAQPATPATSGEGGERAQRATPATPATPAQPHTTMSPQAAAVAAAVAPAAAPVSDTGDAESNIAAVPATPATPATPSTGRAAEVAAAARPTPAADPHVQVARVVRPLRLGDDGSYQLALDLTPAELGRVRIDVEMRGGILSLSLRSDNPATRQLLASSLDQLRSELEAAGLQAGHLDVDSSGAQGRGAASGRQSASNLFSNGSDTTAHAAAPAAPPTVTPRDLATPASGVDVLA